MVLKQIIVLCSFLVLEICSQKGSKDLEIEKIIGEQKRECVNAIGTKKCATSMGLNSKSKESDSFFWLSDIEGVRNTADAWKAVSGKKNRFYKGPAGKDVNITIKAKSNQIVQLNKLTFAVQHVSLAVISAFIQLQDRITPFQFFNRQVPVKSSGKEFTEITVNQAMNLTEIKLQLIYMAGVQEQIGVKKLSLKGCRQDAEVTADDVDTISGSPPEPAPITPIVCRNRHVSSPFFTITDNNNHPETDESLLWQGESFTYVARPRKKVQFTLTASDGGDFEWWRVCVVAMGVARADFYLYAQNIIYLKERVPCNSSAPTRYCYGPWDFDITTKKGVIELIPTSTSTPIQVKSFVAIGCRDHWNHEYVLHTNPGDYRALSINTVRNETITLHGTKDDCGCLTKPEIVHYTDYTGNFNDDVTIKIGEDSLPSQILSPFDTIDFDWVINKQVVGITIQSNKGQFQADIRLDLDQLVALPSAAARKKRQASCSPTDDTKLFLNVIVRQCKSPLIDALVYTEIKASGSKTKVLGRATKRPGLYEVILPRKKSKTQKTALCQCYSQVMKDECAKFAFITRERYRFICRSLRNILNDFTTVDENSRDQRRIHKVCDSAFLAMTYICRTATDSRRAGEKTFFENTCSSGDLVEDDFFDVIGQGKIDVTYFVRKPNAEVVEDGKTTIILNQMKNFHTRTISINEIFVNVFTLPLRPLVQHGYQISVHYNCGDLDSLIFISILSNTFGRTTTSHMCRDTEGSDVNKCSCCDFTVPGSSNRFAKFEETVLDHLQIDYFKNGTNHPMISKDFYVLVN